MYSILLSIYIKEKPEYLKLSLESIFSQKIAIYEVIIVEDGPLTKELYSLLDEYERKYQCIKRIVLEKNCGLGKALNEGLKHCSYDLVARMDTDDIAYPTRFEKQIKFMTEHPEIDACSSWIDEFVDSTDNIVSTKKLPETNEEIRKYAKFRSPLNHPAVMFRKQAVINAGGYKHFYLFEDYYLWARMIMNNSKMYNIQESLLYFRYSPEMIKRRGGWKYAKSEVRLQKEFYRIGFIGLGTFMKNITIRMIVRMIPNELRNIIYKKILRK